MGDHARKHTGSSRGTTTESDIQPDCRTLTEIKQVQKLNGDRGGKWRDRVDTTDKEDWEGTRREEEEICLILLQDRAVSAPRQGGTENTQDAEPDGVDVVIDTPRAGEHAQRSGGQNNGAGRWELATNGGGGER